MSEPTFNELMEARWEYPTPTPEELEQAERLRKAQIEKTNKKLEEEYNIGDLCWVSCVDIQNNRWEELALMVEPKLNDKQERQIFILGQLSWFPATQISKTKEEAIEWNSQ